MGPRIGSADHRSAMSARGIGGCAIPRLRSPAIRWSARRSTLRYTGHPLLGQYPSLQACLPASAMDARGPGGKGRVLSSSGAVLALVIVGCLAAVGALTVMVVLLRRGISVPVVPVKAAPTEALPAAALSADAAPAAAGRAAAVARRSRRACLKPIPRGCRRTPTHTRPS